MRAGSASSSFASIVAITAISGQRNDHGRAHQQPDRPKPPAASVDRRTNALLAGPPVAPGQLVLVQSAGQAQPAPAQTHRQGVAAYPSLTSNYQVISGAGTFSRLYTPVVGTNLYDFEI